jgi:hypothetical protein
MISQRVMNKYSNHDYINSQLLDCGVDKSLTSEQNYVDLMTPHRLERIYNLDNTMSSYSEMSSKLPSATSIEFLG